VREHETTRSNNTKRRRGNVAGRERRRAFLRGGPQQPHPLREGENPKKKGKIQGRKDIIGGLELLTYYHRERESRQFKEDDYIYFL